MFERFLAFCLDGFVGVICTQLLRFMLEKVLPDSCFICSYEDADALLKKAYPNGDGTPWFVRIFCAHIILPSVIYQAAAMPLFWSEFPGQTPGAALATCSHD